MDNNSISESTYNPLKTLRNYALTFLVAAVIGFVAGRCSVIAEQPKTTTVTRIDTLRVEKPIPYEVEKIREVSVPVYVQVPTPADTVVQTRIDSVLVNIPVNIEQREYRDALYKAVVSGAVVGDVRPTLEYVEIYARNTTKTVVVPPKTIAPYITGFGGKDILGIGGGVFIKGHHGIGADYMIADGKDKLAFRYTYKF